MYKSGDVWISTDDGEWQHVGKVAEDGLSIAADAYNVDYRMMVDPIDFRSADLVTEPIRPIDTRRVAKITFPIEKLNVDALRTIFGMDNAPMMPPVTVGKVHQYNYHVQANYPHHDHIHSAFAMDIDVDSMKVSRETWDLIRSISKRERFARAYGVSEAHIKGATMNEETAEETAAIEEYDSLEPTDDSTVISWVWERKTRVNAHYHETKRYEYAAIRANGRWYPTGAIGHARYNGMSWRELGAIEQTESLRTGDFHIVSAWTHREDLADGE